MFNNYPYQSPYQGYMNQFQQPQQIQQPIQTVQPKTNKIWVTSLEDAMARPVEPNSEYVYLHQDKPLLIEVITDNQGKKTARVLQMKEYTDTPTETPKPKKVTSKDFASKEELEVLKGEIQALKDKVESVIVE